MKEHDIYDQLVRTLTKTMGYFGAKILIQRIETSTTTGVPDVYIQVKGPDWVRTTWVETKQLKDNITAEQYAWLRRVIDCGAQAYVVTRDSDGTLLWLDPEPEMLDHNSLKSWYKAKCNRIDEVI